MMPIGWWNLNYLKYDPDYNPSNWDHVFRDGIYKVSDDNIEGYIKSIEGDKLELDFLEAEINDEVREDIGVSFFIDFDKKIYVNGVFEVELEKYLPDDNWKGISDDPISFLPEYLKDIFNHM
jgi:hypothetical protein